MQKDTSQPKELLQPNFILGQMADDLVKTTVEICGRKQDKGSRFPKYLYDTYVNRILEFSLQIQSDVFIANETEIGKRRIELEKEAASLCVPFSHLVRISYENKWISEKQCERWLRLIKNVKYKIVALYKSDIKRV